MNIFYAIVTMLFVTQKDADTFKDDPVEYIRCMYDDSETIYS